jgi:cytoskeleton protein RodZ
LVGESPTELQALYAESTKAQPALPDLTRIARGEPESESARLVAPAVIGVIAVAVIGMVWWVLNLSGDKVQPTPLQGHLDSRPAAESAVPGPNTDAASINAEADSQNPDAVPAPTEPTATSQRAQPGAGKPATKPAPNAAARLTAATPTPIPSAAPATTPARVAAATPASNTPATAPNPSPRAKDGELTLRFSSDSWAEVYDASGQRLFYDVGAASSAHTVKGPAPLRVVLGNASGVAVEYNGRPALIPASSQPDGSARFVINAHGRAIPASATAHDGD